MTKEVGKVVDLTSALREIIEISKKRELIRRLEELEGSEEFEEAVGKVVSKLSGNLGFREGDAVKEIIDVIDWRIEKKLEESKEGE